MKKALIEQVRGRLCQVEPVNPNPQSGGIPFPVAVGLEWRDCPDDVRPETHDFDGSAFVLKPVPPPAVVQRLQLDAQELAEAKIDNAIMALVNATPAARLVWARDNFPTLTLAEQNRMGMILNILAVAVRPRVR